MAAMKSLLPLLVLIGCRCHPESQPAPSPVRTATVTDEPSLVLEAEPLLENTTTKHSPHPDTVSPEDTGHPEFEVMTEEQLPELVTPLGALDKTPVVWTGRVSLPVYQGPVSVTFSGADGDQKLYPYFMRASYGVDVQDYGNEMTCGFFPKIQPGGWRAAWCRRFRDEKYMSPNKMEIIRYDARNITMKVGFGDMFDLHR